MFQDDIFYTMLLKIQCFSFRIRFPIKTLPFESNVLQVSKEENVTHFMQMTRQKRKILILCNTSYLEIKESLTYTINSAQLVKLTHSSLLSVNFYLF